MSDYTVVARIVRPFGTAGEVKALLETDYPEALKSHERFFLISESDEVREYKVDSLRFHQGAILVKLRGVNSIESAEALRGVCLAVPNDERAELRTGEFWLDDIVGLEAFTEDGEPLGAITEVICNPANDVWVTDIAMIPAVKEIVVSVDVAAGKVVVRPIEGLKTKPDK